MADDQTPVDHLLLGRGALETQVDEHNAEIQRLTAAVEQLGAAIDQLNSVIDMVGPGGATSAAPRSAPLTRVEPKAVTVNTGSSDASARKATARTRKPRGNAPKSIRVHVLEMLATEDRDWSLSEIIDRVHDAGIQAHDDAVRSITIKLMKDGRVQRVGRGQYRLARRGSSRTTPPSSSWTPPATQTEAPTDGTEPTDVSVAPEPLDALDDTAPDTAENTVDMVDDAAPDETVVDVDEAPVVDDAAAATETVTEGEAPADATEMADTEPESVESPAEPDSRPYSPPLNLGQPWG